MKSNVLSDLIEIKDQSEEKIREFLEGSTPIQMKLLQRRIKVVPFIENDSNLVKVVDLIVAENEKPV